jgi:hypothetical protein
MPPAAEVAVEHQPEPAEAIIEHQPEPAETIVERQQEPAKAVVEQPTEQVELVKEPIVQPSKSPFSANPPELSNSRKSKTAGSASATAARLRGSSESLTPSNAKMKRC